VLLPLHNAVRVAEDAATIDIISNGRFDLGVGQGYAPGEFAAYGVDRKTRADARRRYRSDSRGVDQR